MTKTAIHNFLYFLLAISLLLVISCNETKKKEIKPNTSKNSTVIESKELSNDTIYRTKNLILVKLSDNSYQHISFLNTNTFGRVNCNGMLVVNDNEAVIFDTPADNEGSQELINYVSQNLKSKIIAVIATHFHEDCIGGISVFEENKIQTYASFRTKQFLKAKGNKYAENIKGFNDSLTLTIGNQKIIAKYFGEGHTKDNIIGYYPTENILFGGCLVKELGAKKGNLEDANTKAWPSTISKLKKEYPNVKIIIPGHGKSGNVALLDYTESLFR